MKCRDMVEVVTHYLEGALPLGHRLSAGLHLMVCSPCRRYVAQIRQTIQFLGRRPPPPPSAREDEILALLASERRDRPSVP